MQRGPHPHLWLPPEEPKEIPDHLRHGSSVVYRVYKCRCARCRQWHRCYQRDYKRDYAQGIRRRPHGRLTGQGGWYVCLDGFGDKFRLHLYENDRCIRCGADRAEEELWEERWLLSGSTR